MARHGWVAATVAVGALLSMPGSAGPPDTDEVDDGRHVFQIYCQSCHGESGRGDGPAAAQLKTRPTDLTTIAPGPDGAFPREDVYRKIEGIDRVAGHRATEMPLWGFAFRELGRDTGQTEEVDARIRALVAYLETLQPEDD